MFRICSLRTLAGRVRLFPDDKATGVRVLAARFSADWRKSSGHENDVPDLIRTYDPTWLRLNCRCPECFSHVTRQRKLTLSDLRPEQRSLIGVSSTSSDGRITVRWADGHVSEYDLEWLNRKVYPGERDPVRRRLWDGAAMRSVGLDRIPASELADPDAGVKRLVRRLIEYGVAAVGGVEPSVEATRRVVESVSFVQETIYGRMWSLTPDMSRQDSAYTSEPLPAHTDTAYLSQPAGLQVFHCLERRGSGGETLLVDGFRAAETLRRRDPDAFRTLCRHPIHHEYEEAGYEHVHHLRSVAPVLTVDPASGELEAIRYNDGDRSTISTIPQPDVGRYYEALAALGRRITDPEAEFWIRLEPGTVLFVDNWRVLHGRSAFTGVRRLCGCYLPRDDWRSRARVWRMIV